MKKTFQRVRGVLGMERTLMQPDRDDVTSLTQASEDGDQFATERLWAMCQAEIHTISRSLLRGEQHTVTLQTTVLVKMGGAHDERHGIQVAGGGSGGRAAGGRASFWCA